MIALAALDRILARMNKYIIQHFFLFFFVVLKEKVFLTRYTYSVSVRYVCGDVAPGCSVKQKSHMALWAVMGLYPSIG